MRGSTTAATNSVSKFAAQRIMFDPHYYYYFLFCTCLLLYSVLFWSAVAVRGARGVGGQGLEKGSLLASLHRASQTSINFCVCECVCPHSLAAAKMKMPEKRANEAPTRSNQFASRMTRKIAMRQFANSAAAQAAFLVRASP